MAELQGASGPRRIENSESHLQDIEATLVEWKEELVALQTATARRKKGKDRRSQEDNPHQDFNDLIDDLEAIHTVFSTWVKFASDKKQEQGLNTNQVFNILKEFHGKLELKVAEYEVYLTSSDCYMTGLKEHKHTAQAKGKATKEQCEALNKRFRIIISKGKDALKIIEAELPAKIIKPSIAQFLRDYSREESMVMLQNPLDGQAARAPMQTVFDFTGKASGSNTAPLTGKRKRPADSEVADQPTAKKNHVRADGPDEEV